MTTKTLTEKLNERADKQLNEALRQLITPLSNRLSNTTIPHDDRVRHSKELAAMRDAIFAAEHESNREREISTFLSRVEEAHHLLQDLSLSS